MTDQLLHTPDGVRDIYNGECRQKLLLQEKLHEVLKQYGYRDIQTPTFEFFNIFSQEIGTTPSKDLYKFFDKDGNTLVLRPDFTPSIVRSAAKYYTDELIPVRLCYMGNTFINSSSYQGRLKENTQCGVELIGEASIAADAEILAMVVDSLRTGGLTEFQVSVGHTQFFKGLVKEANLDSEREEELRELLSNKNFFGVEEFVETLDISSDLKHLFSLLGHFDTTAEELEKAKTYATDYPEILIALSSLQQLDNCMKIYGIEKYISFELGIVSDYNYYTGIIFYGYTFGTGEPVVRGGRYDTLPNYFGKHAPAIGFAIVVDQLLAALSRQKISLPVQEEHVLFVYEEASFAQAVQKAGHLREQGSHVTLVPFDEKWTRDDYCSYAVKHHISKVEFM